MPRKTLSVTDNRTGKEYELSVSNGTIQAMDLRQSYEGHSRRHVPSGISASVSE